MIKNMPRKVVFLFVLLASLILNAAPADLSGTWSFSVDLEGGGHGDPTFVLQQEGAKLTGTYSGPMGEQKVTGTIYGNNGNRATFGFELDLDGVKSQVTYTATIDSSTAMHGTVEFKSSDHFEAGKWTATKK
jgi:hypothetical protein